MEIAQDIPHFKALLSVKDIAVAYAGIPVLRGIGFSLAPGEIGCLLGPSGCGKSTVLRAIAGFEPLIEGEIVMRAEVLSSAKQMVPAEQRRIGMVFQDFALFPHLSIADNIKFGLQSWRTSEQNNRVAALLELVDLKGYEKRFPHSLLGLGAMARATAIRCCSPPDKECGKRFS